MFNGPLRQYFSLYQARKKERRSERIEREKKAIQTSLLQVQQTQVLLQPNLLGRPGHENYPVPSTFGNADKTPLY